MSTFIQYEGDIYEVPKDLSPKIADQLIRRGLAHPTDDPRDKHNQVIINLERTSCRACYKTDTNLYFVLRPNEPKELPRHILFTYCYKCFNDVAKYNNGRPLSENG